MLVMDEAYARARESTARASFEVVKKLFIETHGEAKAKLMLKGLLPEVFNAYWENECTPPSAS